jgi:hypothetical protein
MPPKKVEQESIVKYPEYIMSDLRQRRRLEGNDTSKDELIMNMNKDRVLDEVCNWNGLINYGSTIRNWVEDIYGIKLN